MENSFRCSIYENENNYFVKAMKDTFQINRRSIISTSKSKENNETCALQKCKIKALPRHSTVSFDKREYFMIVFQAIQIERLSQQIETQRVKIKSLQRKIINSQNYEIQIKQLTDQCNKLQIQISQYREQLEKMNSICEKLYHQNTTNKQKYHEEQKKLRKKLQQQMDKNRKTAHQLEQIKLQRRRNTRQVVEKQFARQKMIEKYEEHQELRLKQKIQEIEKLQKQIIKIKQVNCEAQKQLQNLKKSLSAAEQKLVIIDEDQLMIQNLNNQLKSVKDQNEGLTKAIKQKQVQLQAALKRKGCNRSPQKESCNKKVSFTTDTIQQNQKINQLSQQICRLSELLMHKNKIIDELYEKISELKAAIKKSEAINSSQSISQQSSSEEKDLLRQKNAKLESAIKEIQSLKEEVENYRKKLDEKSKQSDSFKQKQASLIKQLTDIQNLRSACQNQQFQTIKMLKNLQLMQKSSKQISSLLISEKKRSSELPLKLENYRRNSTTLKSNNLIESVYSNEGNGWKKGLNQFELENAENILHKISQLQTTINELRSNYNSAFLRTAKNGKQNNSDLIN